MSCTKCGSENVIIHRRYSGQHLCKKCFIETIQKKVLKDIKKYELIKKGDKVLVALSGGKDSTTVLDILSILAQRNIIELEAITIDEGIKDYREKGIEYASETCKKLGIPQHIFSFKEHFKITIDEIMASKPPRKACTYCGVLRRWILNKEAKKLGADKIATGHNLDDEVQAIVMNYLEGNIENLTRIGPATYSQKFVTKIKPLREIPEKEVTAYVMAKGLKVHLEECPYRKTSFRKKIGTILTGLSKDHPTILYSTLRGHEKIRNALKKELKGESILRECIRCGQPAARDLCKTCTLLKEIGRLKDEIHSHNR
ncbi:MAG: TIGR00269 family protein [Methanobacteriaceae archaeon]|nr:TIGR00269 family protein [Methanobacteriaceae archaeon]